MTAEAMSVVSGFTYKIDDAAKEIFDPGAALAFFENGIASSTPIASVDLLAGTVTFTGAPTTPITVTGNYLPRVTAANAFSFSANKTREIIETTVFGQTSKRRIAGLLDASGEIRSRDFADFLIGANKISDLFDGGTVFIISFLPGAGLNSFRVRALIETLAVDADAGGQVEATLSWTLAGTENPDGRTVFYSG